eukprot:13955227-Alexandrium_andersonii.AAC.1
MASGGRSLNCVAPDSTSNVVPELPRGEFCSVLRAGSDGDDEKLPRLPKRTDEHTCWTQTRG